MARALEQGILAWESPLWAQSTSLVGIAQPLESPPLQLALVILMLMVWSKLELSGSLVQVLSTAIQALSTVQSKPARSSIQILHQL
jgi:hypothetical protein